MATRSNENMSYKRPSKVKKKSFKSPQDAVAQIDQEMEKIDDGRKMASPDLDHVPNSFMLTRQPSNIQVENNKLNVEDEIKKNEASSFEVEEKKNNINNYAPEVSKKLLKSREEILAEREAKKLAKQALKNKIKETNLNKADKIHNVNLKKNPSVELKKNISREKVESLLHGTEKTDENYKCDEDKKLNVSHEISKEPLAPPLVENIQKSENKTKAQLRAERRDKQEAQRAKKLEKMKNFPEEKVISVPQKSKTVKNEIKIIKTLEKSQEKIHKVKLFAHLYSSLFDCIELDVCGDVHPSIVQLGTQYRSKVISGANARCLALLNALKTVIQDYQTPPNQEFSRGVEAEISRSVNFLNKCRPIAVSMANAVKLLKFQVNQLSGNEIDSKKQINEWIDTYIKEQIEKAAEAIALFVLQKISDGDVILIYSCSSLIKKTLIKANEAKIKFRVIVVDGRPWLEGKEMLRKLVKAGIRCTYVFFNGLSFIMPEVTKILLSAHTLLANGYVMSRAGSSQIALMAKAYNVPVLVCCETNKFSEKVQTDSFVYNELGEPYELISKNKCSDDSPASMKTLQYLTPLNLTYDVTPPDLVSAVVTEVAVLPCTSIPVILRIKPSDGKMKHLSDERLKLVFEKLSKYIGPNVKLLIDRPDGTYCFREQKNRVYYISEKILGLSSNISSDNLISAGTCFGKFTKTGKFRLGITALTYIAPYAQYKIWLKPSAEQQFLYGHHVLKSGLGKMTENTEKYQGVLVLSMNDIPLGFGLAGKSTAECKLADPLSIVCFHQADIGEYLRSEENLL